MRSYKKYLIAALSVCMLLSVPVHATDVQGTQIENESAPLTTAVTVAETEKETEAPDKLETAIMLIGRIDPAAPDRKAVKEAREAVSALTFAQQMRVTNLQTLLDAEDILGMSQTGPFQTEGKNEETADTEAEKTGNKYSFMADQENGVRISLSVRFMTDKDNDGITDVPDITLTDPRGNRVNLTQDMTAFHSTDTEMDITWSASFMQIDVKKASSGVWTVRTSNRCTFVRSTHSVPVAESPYKEEPEPETRRANNPDKSEPAAEKQDETVLGIQKGLFMDIVKIVGFLAASIAILVFLWKFLSPSSSKKPKNGKNKADKKEKDADDFEDDEDDSPKPMSEEEELRRIRMDYEANVARLKETDKKSRAQREAEEKKAAKEQPDKKEPKEEKDDEVDERLFYTQANMDADETVEEFLDKDESFFGFSNFGN